MLFHREKKQKERLAGTEREILNILTVRMGKEVSKVTVLEHADFEDHTFSFFSLIKPN